MKKGEPPLESRPLVNLFAILGRLPTATEYMDAVIGIKLIKFSPSLDKPQDPMSIHF